MTMKDAIRKEVRCWVVKNHWWIELDDKLTLDDITDFVIDKTLAAAIKVVKKLRDEDKARYAGYHGYRNGDYVVVLAMLKEMEK